MDTWKIDEIARNIDVAFVANDNKLIGSKHDLEFANIIADGLGDAQYLVSEVKRLTKELDIALNNHEPRIAALEAATPDARAEATRPLYSVGDRVQHHNGAIGTVVVNDDDGWIGWTKDGDTSHTFTHKNYMTPYFDYDEPRQLVRCGDLKPGDYVLREDGHWSEVESVSVVLDRIYVTVRSAILPYNWQINDTHYTIKGDGYTDTTAPAKWNIGDVALLVRCELCGGRLVYGENLKWTCDTCSSDYSDTLQRIPDKYDQPAPQPSVAVPSEPKRTLEQRLMSGKAEDRTIERGELQDAIALIQAGKVQPIEGRDYHVMPATPAPASVPTGAKAGAVKPFRLTNNQRKVIVTLAGESGTTSVGRIAYLSNMTTGRVRATLTSLEKRTLAMQVFQNWQLTDMGQTAFHSLSSTS